MTLLQKDYSPGWMGVLINSATGPRNNRTTLGGRTAFTPLVLDVDTRGMTWIVLRVINTLVKKVKSFLLCYVPFFLRLPLSDHHIVSGFPKKRNKKIEN